MAEQAKKKTISVPAIFIIYIVSAWILIQGFRFISPGEEPPIEYFSVKWRLLCGVIEYMEIYAALAISALILPFAVKIPLLERANSSTRFLESIKNSVLTAFAAACIYALVSLLLLPAAKDYELDLRSRGKIYNSAKESAFEHADKREWDDTLRFLGICDQIWPESPGLETIRSRARVGQEDMRFGSGSIHQEEKKPASAEWPNLPDQAPPNASAAIAMAETAMKEERYFDANWLASFASKLAGPGNAEAAAAARLASQAWAAINLMEPTQKETEAYQNYRMKREGYEALINEDWIRAYYIFLELRETNPWEPDIEKYFSLSEQGCTTVAFFYDEQEFAMGSTLADAVFSMPYNGGRMVVRFAYLSLFPDVGYGTGMEIFAFDRDSLPAWRMKAPNVKLTPLGFENYNGETETRVSLICRVLDRRDQNIGSGPEIEGMGNTPPYGDRITLEAGWDDFLILADMFNGKTYFSIKELMDASKIAEKYGYLHEVFEAEVLCRFANQIFFMAMAITALAAGWRYRPIRKPYFIFVPMLAALPIVFNWLIHFGRNVINNAAIWSIITFGFNTAALIFGAASLIVFIASMAFIATQRE